MGRPDPHPRARQDRIFVLVILASVLLIHFLVPQKTSFINFYFLPVIVAGLRSGVRTAVPGALLCVLLVALYALWRPDLFLTVATRQELVFHLMAWGGFLVLAGWVVGKQRERHADLEEKERVATVVGLSKLAEYRDQDTGFHLLRIRGYTEILARALAELPAYRGYLHEGRIKDMLLSCALHDIGKVGVPDAVLLKPGRLTPAEFELVKRHPGLGKAALEEIRKEIGHRHFLEMAEQIALHHHERWDGSGYPNGLAGVDIPLSARIVALADVYDALTSDRPYKEAYDHERARAIILEEMGGYFDPQVVAVFLENEEAFQEVRLAYQDRSAAAARKPAGVPARGPERPVTVAVTARSMS